MCICKSANTYWLVRNQVRHLIINTHLHYIVAPGISFFFFENRAWKGLFPCDWFCIVCTPACPVVLEWYIIEQSITLYPREQVSPTLRCVFPFNRWELNHKSALSQISAHWGRTISQTCHRPHPAQQALNTTVLCIAVPCFVPSDSLVSVEGE